MSTSTITALSDLTGVAVETGWEPDFEVPVLTGFQRQGDVLVAPSKGTAETVVPESGCPVVRGESGGNTHAIFADGPGVLCDVRTATTGDLRVATLSVPAGSAAYLSHPEHGFLGIGPGTYEIRRQREQAEELRMVAD